MTAEPRANAYPLYYRWPYKMIAPLCALLGIAYPLLLRFVENRPIDRVDWTLAVGLLVLGGAAAVYFGRTISVSQEAIEFRNPFRARRLTWDRVARLDLRDEKFVLISTSGDRYAIDRAMSNGDVFARELDARSIPGNSTPR